MSAALSALVNASEKQSANDRATTKAAAFFSPRPAARWRADDEVCLLSVGVDIGSSTSHLVFSRIVLERLDSRYVVTERETFYASDILLTPYSAEDTIDAEALGAFIAKEYADAKVDPDEIDTGALILTGVAVRRSNARAIGELFAKQAGKLVAVSAGDSLETVMAAYGSGAVARSIRDDCTVMNVDVGGGTSKIAVCADGKVTDLAALDVGARLVCLEADGRIVRVEDAGRRYGAELGLELKAGGMLTLDQGRAIASLMADKLFEAMRGGAPSAQGVSLLRTDPLAHRGAIDQIQFSGGVVGVHLRQREQEVRRPRPAARRGNPRPRRGVLPAARGLDRGHPRHRGRRLAIHHPAQRQHDLCRAARRRAAAQRAGDRAGAAARRRHDRSRRGGARHRGDAQAARSGGGEQPVAVFVPWQGSATFQRLDAFCRGVVDGLAGVLSKGHPLVLAGDGDVGGLLGIHLHEEMKIANAVVSIDGLELKEFDYIDIGTMLESSGAVPVVIKSLMFPAAAGAKVDETKKTSASA